MSLISVPLTARDLLLGAVTFVSCDAAAATTRTTCCSSRTSAGASRSRSINARLFEIATKAVAARDEMLSIVAHDLRSPLSAASLAASALVRPEDERRAAGAPDRGPHRSARSAAPTA